MRSSRDKVREVASSVGQKLETLKTLFVQSSPNRWKVAHSTCSLSPVRVAERQPSAPPFQLTSVRRTGAKSLVESTESEARSLGLRSQGSAKVP